MKNASSNAPKLSTFSFDLDDDALRVAGVDPAELRRVNAAEERKSARRLRLDRNPSTRLHEPSHHTSDTRTCATFAAGLGLSVEDAGRQIARESGCKRVLTTAEARTVWRGFVASMLDRAEETWRAGEWLSPAIWRSKKLRDRALFSIWGFGTLSCHPQPVPKPERAASILAMHEIVRKTPATPKRAA